MSTQMFLLDKAEFIGEIRKTTLMEIILIVVIFLECVVKKKSDKTNIRREPVYVIQLTTKLGQLKKTDGFLLYISLTVLMYIQSKTVLILSIDITALQTFSRVHFEMKYRFARLPPDRQAPRL